MPTFSYSVKRSGASKVERGEMEAENVGAANKTLRGQGLVVLEIKSGAAKQGLTLKIKFKKSKVAMKERIIFSRQLSVMIKAGLSIVRALESLARQTESEYFKEIIKDLIVQVQGGQVLSKAMSKYPKVFVSIYTAVVQAGEQTGQLAEVLLNLADQQEKEADLISKVRGAMIYPGIIFTLLISVMILIVVFVIPALKPIFTESGAQLPLLTRILLGSSDIARKYYWIIIPVVVGVIVGLKTWFKAGRGQMVYDKLKVTVPIFGSLTKKVYMARFSRTMAMLMKASLPILQSIQIIRQTISNVHYNEAFERIEHSVESGKTFSMSINKEPLFPPMVGQLVSLGEESGSMEAVLLDIANFYDKEIDTMTKNLTTLLEPIMMIVMGIGVGFVVASVLGPIYGLVQAF